MNAVHLTICDARYVVPALALFRSLQCVSSQRSCIYAADPGAVRLLKSVGLSGGSIIGPDEFIPAEVEQLRSTRSPVGFAFTLKSIALLDAARRWPDADWLGYFDSDMLAFAEPAAMFERLPAGSAACFTPHRFAPEFVHYRQRVGTYNAGFVGFRNSPAGLAILDAWKRRCLEWCEPVIDGGRFADQKYLDALAAEFSDVRATPHPGANVGPWNIGPCQIDQRGEAICIDGHPLLFYHFQGLRRHGRRLVDLYSSNELFISGPLRRLIYDPYLEALNAAAAQLQKANPVWTPPAVPCSWKRRIRFLTSWMLRLPTNACWIDPPQAA